ncbi:MAG: MlaD family protein [Candidatus Cloacimonetes bacterium]|nr:MlaD family protein [Candidatus Cloacimonadota bacterium]
MKFYQNKKSLEFKVGLFVIVAIIILVVSYSWFTEILESRKYTNLKVKFENAGNIELGSTVTINGVKKGRVKELKIEVDGVVILLQAEIEFPLKKGTKFYILESNLMGDVLLEIVPGRQGELLNLGEVQNGEKSYGLTKLVSELSEVIFELQSIMEIVTKDGEFVRNLQSIVDTSVVMVNKINNSIDVNAGKIDKLITNASNISERLSRLIEDNQEDFSSSVSLTSNVLEKLDKNLLEMNEITENFKLLSQKMLNEESTFNKIISEEELYENLLKSSASLDSLLKDIKKNPKKYFKIKVF